MCLIIAVSWNHEPQLEIAQRIASAVVLLWGTLLIVFNAPLSQWTAALLHRLAGIRLRESQGWIGRNLAALLGVGFLIVGLFSVLLISVR
ncbi:MAG: hypothetical protein C4289_14015 [Chloroflexota bacterium]